MSVLEIDSLHTAADTCKHLVRYCANGIRKDCDRQIVAEDFNGITLLAVYIRNVYHRYIHADVAYIRRFLAVYQTITMPASKPTVKSVGITNRNCGNETVPCEYSLAAVAHGFVLRHSMNLQYRGLQRAYIIYYGIIPAVNAVQSETEATHVKLAFRKVLYTSGIVHVTYYFVAERRLKFLASLLEKLELVGREVVEIIAVRAYKV